MAMGDLGGTQLLGNHSHPFSFQPFELSPTEVFAGDPFGFSPAASPAPDHSRQHNFGPTLESQSHLSEFDPPSFLGLSDLRRPTWPKKRQCHSGPSQAVQQPSRLDIPLVSNTEKHGQLTPPSETTPTREIPPLTDETAQLDHPRATTTLGPATRKNRSTPKTQASKTPPQSVRGSPRRRKARKQAVGGPSLGTHEKRGQFLERNRIAASKCRQKKKEWTANLESRARELQASKTSLGMLVSSLREELLYLKGEALKHTTCDCHAVREYLARPSTTSFARNLLDDVGSPGSGSNLSLTAIDFSNSSTMRDGASSSVVTGAQDLADLGILDDLPD